MLLSCHVFLTLLSLMKMSPRDIPMVVVFGRPGAGKTAVADRAVELLLLHPQQQSLRSSSILRPIGLDLDVCVPQWMRDNFAKGFYRKFFHRGQRTGTIQKSIHFCHNRLTQYPQ